MAAEEVVSLPGLAFGGASVGRLADGRAVFVPYTVPGETARVEVTERRRSWARGRLLEVVSPSPDRVEAPCPYFGIDRCGGCRLQHVAGERQADMARQVVTETLQRIGGIADPPVAAAIRPADYGYRSRARFGVDASGRLGYRRAGSHDLLPIDRCLLLDEPTQRAREAAGDAWLGTREVEVRSSPGGAALSVRGDRPGTRLPDGEIPVASLRGSGRAAPLRGDPVLVESVAGYDFRVSPASFFQASRAGAAVLLGLVREAAAVRPGDTVLDLFAGVGLFARGLADDGATVTAVEGADAAAADARHNLAGLAEVVTAPVDEAVAALVEAGRTVDVAVLDPPRKGAGAQLALALASVATRAIVYVSCDPAALARDARALSEAGWQLRSAMPVDQFAQTGAVEVVATFIPSG